MIKLFDLLNGTTRDPFTGKLYEGLIKTVELPKAIKILHKAFPPSLKGKEAGLTVFKVRDSIEDIEVRIEVVYAKEAYKNKNIEADLSRFVQLVNNLGYFIHGYIIYDYKPYTASGFRSDVITERPWDMTVLLHAKYGKEVQTAKLGKFLYHVAPNKYEAKILKTGLTPRTQSKKSYHPERVYLAIDKKDALDIEDAFAEFDPTAKYTTFAVSVDKLPSSLKFYEDPHFMGGIYTHGNIPPNALSKIK